jgi:hypothetical protein
VHRIVGVGVCFMSEPQAATGTRWEMQTFHIPGGHFSALSPVRLTCCEDKLTIHLSTADPRFLRFPFLAVATAPQGL